MGRQNATHILRKYYDETGDTYRILVAHGDAISKKATAILLRNPELTADADLIEEAAYLHDIGVMETNAPSIGCLGRRDYLEHGIVGGRILEKEGLERHARIAERHIGVGLTAHDIRAGNLPLPIKDMVPVTIEEEIVCFADLFFSKKPGKLHKEKKKEKIRSRLSEFGERQALTFDAWCRKFRE